MAAVVIPWIDKIAPISAPLIANDGATLPLQIQSFWWKILKIVKLLIGGIALIYMVLIWVYMIVATGGEEEIKKQKKQIVNVLMAFLFLNIPGVVYQIFGSNNGNDRVSVDGASSWKGTSNAVFFDQASVAPILDGILSFLRIFTFGAAVLTFTWAAFQLVTSGGDEEKRKWAKNKFVYGILALMFLWFSQVWGGVVASGDFSRITGVTSKIINLSLFFAGPVAIFFLIYGAYHIIMSGGDDEQMKKGKNIIIQTGMATIILIAAFTFLNDLVTFSL
jgi:Type IV secretion system pilin